MSKEANSFPGGRLNGDYVVLADGTRIRRLVRSSSRLSATKTVKRRQERRDALFGPSRERLEQPAPEPKRRRKVVAVSRLLRLRETSPDV